MMEDSRQCEVCLENLVENDSLHMCSDKTHHGLCKSCAFSYINNRIDSSFLGSCQTMICPCAHSDGKRRRILDFKQWRILVPQADLKKYTSLADSILAYLCGGCHSLKSLQIISTEEQIVLAEGILKKSIETVGGTELHDSFKHELNLFVLGELSVEDFYDRLAGEYFSRSMVSGTDQEVWEIVKNVLRLVIDPERRANLHLRHLRSRPRMWTPCCHREHCFRCRTKDFHEGRSCDENTSGLDQSIISCPSCCIAIAKGVRLSIRVKG
jgi:hypothetical protein